MRLAHWTTVTVRNIWFVVALMLIIVLIAMSYLLVQTRLQAHRLTDQAIVLEQQGERAEATRKQILEIAEILVECTTPSTKNDVHECAEQSASAQATSIGQINAVSMAATVCANQFFPPTIELVRECVEKIVSEVTDNPPRE